MFTCANCMNLEGMRETVSEYEAHFGAPGEETVVTELALQNCFKCDFGLGELPVAAFLKALDPDYRYIEAIKKTIGGEIKRKCYKPIKRE